MDFNQLAQATKRINPDKMPKIRLAIMGDSAMQFLAKAIDRMGLLHSLDLDVYHGDYDQIEAEILDSSSKLYAFKPDFIFISQSSIKLKQVFYAINKEEKANFAINHIAGIANILFTLPFSSGLTKSFSINMSPFFVI